MPSIRPSPKWSLLPKSPWQTGRIIFCTSARLGTGAGRITSTPRTDQTPAMGGNRDPASEANKENSSPGIKDQGQGETSSSPATGPGRGNSETHSSMEETDRQPMDPECHTGLSPGAPGSAPRQTYPTSCDSEPRATAGSLDRSGQSNQKVGHSTNFGIERFLQPNFCGSQKGQRLAPSSEPESPQPVRAQSPLQNGKHCLLEGHNPGRRLYGTSGLEGCLPLSAHSKALLEIPAIQMGGEELQVPNAPLWPGISAKGLYKTAASSGSGNEEERRPFADLPRRYTGHGTGKGHPQERFDNGSGDPLGPGLCDQPEEVHFRALNSDRLPGLPSGLQQDGATSPKREGRQSTKGLSSYAQPGDGFSEESRSPDWTINVHSSSYHTSTAPLQGPPMDQEHSPLEEPKLLQDPCGSKERPELVDREGGGVQWSKDHAADTRHDPHIRCIERRLGSDIQTGGMWMVEERTHHINYLKFKAAFLALQMFASRKHNVHILMMIDNRTLRGKRLFLNGPTKSTYIHCVAEPTLVPSVPGECIGLTSSFSTAPGPPDRPGRREPQPD